MKYNFTLDYFQKSADYILSKIDEKPEIALILGSALGGLSEQIENPVVKIFPISLFPPSNPMRASLLLAS